MPLASSHFPNTLLLFLLGQRSIQLKMEEAIQNRKDEQQNCPKHVCSLRTVFMEHTGAEENEKGIFLITPPAPIPIRTPGGIPTTTTITAIIVVVVIVGAMIWQQKMKWRSGISYDNR